jgi:signal transduction histidine kinase
VARETALVRGLLSAIAAFRWLAWAWLAAVLVVSRADLRHPWVAIALAALAFAVTAAATIGLRTNPNHLCGVTAVTIEVAVAFLLSAGDGLAYGGPHSQSLGSAWPLAGILTAGVVFAGRGGLAAGLVVGTGRLIGAGLLPHSWDRDAILSAASTLVLYALAGGAAGLATKRLREAEREISHARARDEVARTLHDGVLQTLAVIQRREPDSDLARLARDQERELRDFLFGTRAGVASAGLVDALRHEAKLFERRYGGKADVVVAEDLPRLTGDAVEALARAVGEALTNAGKHGGAGHVVVYAEPSDDGGVFCSVKDDGSGFEPGDHTPGVGLTRSIVGRVTELGGRAEVDGNPGRGTEVRLWLT